MVTQSVERTALEVLAVLRGGNRGDVTGQTQSLERTMIQILEQLETNGENGLALGTGLPVIVTPGSAGAVGDAVDASPTNHEHPADDVASDAELESTQAEVDTLGIITAPFDDRRITFSALVAPAAPAAAGVGRGIAVRPNGEHVGLAHSTTTFASDYNWTGSAWGSKLVPAVALAGNGTAVDWSPDGAFLVFAHGNPSPWMAGYPIDVAGVFGAQFTPATPPTGDGTACKFNPAGTFVAHGGNISPNVAAVPFAAGAFGVPITPGTPPAGNVSSVAWSPDGAFLCVGVRTTPFVQMYPWDGVTFGSPISPGVALAGQAEDVVFSPDGAYVFIAHTGSPFLTALPWNGSAFGTAIVPSTTPPSTCQTVNVSPSGAFVGVGHGTSPFNHWYGWDGAFGPRITGTTLTNLCRGIDFSPDGSHAFFAVAASPFIEAFEATREFGF